MKTVARVLFAFVFVISLIGTTAQVGKGSPFSANNQQSVATIFSPPLGFRNGIRYSPRFTHDNSGNLIENTDYGIQNPDLNLFSACFGTAWSNLYHAGHPKKQSHGNSTNEAGKSDANFGTISIIFKNGIGSVIQRGRNLAD
jgi:hypothetical protein